MKHKVQEALDNLYDEATTEYDVDDGQLILLDLTNSDRYLDMREPLQQLIDCQLTRGEIMTIATALNHLEVDYSSDNLLSSENEMLKRISVIRTKLYKQKKMWEV